MADPVIRTAGDEMALKIGLMGGASGDMTAAALGAGELLGRAWGGIVIPL